MVKQIFSGGAGPLTWTWSLTYADTANRPLTKFSCFGMYITLYNTNGLKISLNYVRFVSFV
jgi:hypothetical protein